MQTSGSDLPDHLTQDDSPWPGLLVQELRGSLRGIVSDPSGGVIPGAAVRLTNRDAGAQIQTVTNFELGCLCPHSFGSDRSTDFLDVLPLFVAV